MTTKHINNQDKKGNTNGSFHCFYVNLSAIQSKLINSTIKKGNKSYSLWFYWYKFQ